MKKFLSVLITIVAVLGCSSPIDQPLSPRVGTHPNPTGDPDQYLVVHSARGKHQKDVVSTVAVYQSVDGVVVVPDSLFTEPYLFVKNCTGTKIYDPAAYFLVSQPDYSTLVPSDPVCTGAGIGAFQASHGSVTISKPGAVFTVTVSDEPDYALSFMAMPRVVLVISQ